MQTEGGRVAGRGSQGEGEREKEILSVCACERERESARRRGRSIARGLLQPQNQSDPLLAPLLLEGLCTTMYKQEILSPKRYPEHSLEPQVNRVAWDHPPRQLTAEEELDLGQNILLT